MRQRSPILALLAGSLVVPTFAQPNVAVNTPHVLALSHFIHAVNKLGPTTSFYHDLFGLEIPAIRESGGDARAKLHNVDSLTLDVASLTLVPDNVRMELIEFHGVDRKGRQALPTDPGSIQLVLHVRDLDALLDAAKSLNVPIVTTGGAPVTIDTSSGPRRAIVIRDPDGYMVRVIEDTPNEATSPGQLQAGTALDIGVGDLGKTLKWYREDLGLSATGHTTYRRDKAMTELVGAPAKSNYREASFQLPMSNAHLIFTEWKGMRRTKFHERTRDPGAGGFGARVNDLDTMVKLFRAQNINIESKGNAPVWFSQTVYDVYIEDPNGVNLELFQVIPLDQQKQSEKGHHR